MYNGPWLAERYAAIEQLIESSPESLLQTTYNIIKKEILPNAVQTFQAQYQLDDIQRSIAPVWNTIDVLLLPTTGLSIR